MVCVSAIHLNPTDKTNMMCYVFNPHHMRTGRVGQTSLVYLVFVFGLPILCSSLGRLGRRDLHDVVIVHAFCLDFGGLYFVL